MTRTECLAKLNLLGIYTISQFNIRDSFERSLTVGLFDKAYGTGPIGYIDLKKDYETRSYDSYVELLNDAIELSKEK